MAKFPSMKSKKILAILKREPLCYGEVHRVGSHRKLVSSKGYTDLNYAYHDKDTLSGGIVRKILVEKIGLSEEEALSLI